MSIERSYGAESIQSLTGLQHIRHRLSAYIHDPSGPNGVLEVITEVLDNAVDEVEHYTGTDGCVDVVIFRELKEKKFKIAVKDNGRGIPYQKLIDVFSNTLTSGKFANDAESGYKWSAGVFGVGASVTLATSSRFRAITLNKEVIGDAVIHHENIPEYPTLMENTVGQTGSLVIWEPDKEIFDGINAFVEDYGSLVEYLIHVSLFGHYRVRLFVTDEKCTLIDLPTMETIQGFQQLTEQLEPAYDSSTLDRDRYIQDYFELQKQWAGRFPIKGRNPEDTLRVEGDIMVLPLNTIPSNTKLTFVNNILFTDNSSLHIQLLHQYLKDQLKEKISDKPIRKFFLEHYKLPIWLVLDIKYQNAQFSGFAKISFKDGTFAKPYRKLLGNLITQEMVDNIYDIIEEHIVVNYNRFSNIDLKVGKMKHILTKLNRPRKYHGCSTPNRELAELFLVEGDSATPDKDRDSTFQASYTIGGKPYNGLTTLERLRESVDNIKKNHIFSDLIKILNITPGSNDLSKLNFGKIMIMADADTHGYHITNILLGNLYALCPALIESGKVYVVKAPLYSLNIKGQEPIYIRDAEELNATLAYHVYYRCVDVKISSDNFERTLSREEFVAFNEIVSKIGDELERLSNEYMIPAALLEQLSLMTSHLNVARPNVEEISRWLGYEVRYVESSNLLIVSVGMDDVIVPLTQITELIYKRILPMYRTFRYGRTRISATTKRSNLLNDDPITIVQLYQMFLQLKKLFTIERYKGLGDMAPADLARTCTNPKTRRVYQVTEVGDVQKIFDMMGTDPKVRKELMLA